MTRMTLVERRQKLIAAALAVIARAGVPGATTRAIAAEAGMPLASFHYAFESHQALMSEATRVVLDGELDRLQGLDLHGDTRDEVLEGLLDQHLADVAARQQDHHRIQELLDYAFRTDGQQEVPAQWRRERVQVLAGLLRVADAPGDVDALADVAVTMCDGLTNAYMFTQDTAAGRRAIAAWTRPDVLAS